ncbi:MAG: DUF115 domain-containing protein [Verrucomicrobiota bacterium JB022]|nr:DUF115 domain-containing protein [Verrucomicrobiota bacterium JB022]
MIQFLRQIKHQWHLRRQEMGRELELQQRRNWQQLAALKGKHRGQRAFVIGNGPSLRIADLERLRGEITFATNGIVKAFDQTDWRPTYYVMVDHLNAENFRPLVMAAQGPQKLFAFDLFEHYREDPKALFFRKSPPPADEEPPPFSYQPQARVSTGCTVTYDCLQWAVFMGIKEIYLLGVDWDYQYANDAVARQSGEYTIREQQDSRNHFLPNYFEPNQRYLEPLVSKQYAAYRAARREMDQRDWKIANASRGGKLDVFPRVDFDAVVPK